MDGSESKWVIKNNALKPILNLYIHLSNPSLFGTEKRDTNKKYSTYNALSRIELFVTTKNAVTWISSDSKYRFQI